MKRRILQEEEEEDEPVAQPSEPRQTRRRKDQPAETKENIAERKVVINLVEEEDDSDNEQSENESSQQSGTKKRLRRSTVSKRIVASNPGTTANAGATAASAAASKPMTRLRSAIVGAPEVAPLPPLVDDLDARRENDPLYVTTYASQAYEYLRGLQFKYGQYSIEAVRPRPPQRGFLVDWMVHAVEEYCMSVDVLFLSVSLLDRALQNFDFKENELQLLATTCMLIACKLEDVFTPSVDEFLQMTNDAFQKRNLLDMEREMLRRFDFQLQCATTKQFMRRFQRAAHVLETDEKLLGNYIAELTLPVSFFLRFTPTLVAASVVYVTRFILAMLKERATRPPGTSSGGATSRIKSRISKLWTPTLVHYTEYGEVQIAHVVRKLFYMYGEAQKGEATLASIRTKYQSRENLEVAELAVDEGWVEYLPRETDETLTEGGT